MIGATGYAPNAGKKPAVQYYVLFLPGAVFAVLSYLATTRLGACGFWTSLEKVG